MIEKKVGDMQSKRLFAVFLVMIFVVAMCLVSSPVFAIKELAFSFPKNDYFTLDTLTTSLKDVKGTHVFNFNKADTLNLVEQTNPYIKPLDAKLVLPNKLVVSMALRTPVAYFLGGDKAYLVDDDLKLLDVAGKIPVDLCEIEFVEYNSAKNFFEFFGVSEVALSCGQFLTDNNKVFSATKNLFHLLNKAGIRGYVAGIAVYEVGNQDVEITIKTITPFGVKIKILDALNFFDDKLTKTLNALLTLNRAEKIKTTYGEIKIDKNCNCFWNNL